ncbi:UNVERIFIED_CONTAM: hypothetical protein K2H54_043517 [Gekko kuhli]
MFDSVSWQCWGGDKVEWKKMKCFCLSVCLFAIELRRVRCKKQRESKQGCKKELQNPTTRYSALQTQLFFDFEKRIPAHSGNSLPNSTNHHPHPPLPTWYSSSTILSPFYMPFFFCMSSQPISFFLDFIIHPRSVADIVEQLCVFIHIALGKGLFLPKIMNSVKYNKDLSLPSLHYTLLKHFFFCKSNSDTRN